jgi:hypothetical protein
MPPGSRQPLIAYNLGLLSGQQRRFYNPLGAFVDSRVWGVALEANRAETGILDRMTSSAPQSPAGSKVGRRAWRDRPIAWTTVYRCWRHSHRQTTFTGLERAGGSQKPRDKPERSARYGWNALRYTQPPAIGSLRRIAGRELRAPGANAVSSIESSVQTILLDYTPRPEKDQAPVGQTWRQRPHGRLA